MGWAARLSRDASLRRRRCATHTVARGTRAELGCAALPRRPAESSPRAFLGTTDLGVVPGWLGSLVPSVAHSVAGSGNCDRTIPLRHAHPRQGIRGKSAPREHARVTCVSIPTPKKRPNFPPECIADLCDAFAFRVRALFFGSSRKSCAHACIPQPRVACAVRACVQFAAVFSFRL